MQNRSLPFLPPWHRHACILFEQLVLGRANPRNFAIWRARRRRRRKGVSYERPTRGARRNSIFVSQVRVAEWRLGTKVANSPKQVQWWFCVFSNRFCSIYLSAFQNGPVTQPRTRCVRGHAAHLIFLKVTNCKKISSLDNGAHSSYPGGCLPRSSEGEREVKSMSVSSMMRARDANGRNLASPHYKAKIIIWLVGWFHSGGRRRDLSCIKRDNKLIWQNGTTL